MRQFICLHKLCKMHANANFSACIAMQASKIKFYVYRYVNQILVVDIHNNTHYYVNAVISLFTLGM